MEKSIISGRQASCIMIMFLIGSTTVTGSSVASKQDSWISFILAMIISIPFILIYCKILKLFPDKNLYDIVYEIFGKIGGLIISLMFIFYALQLGAIVIRKFTEFIQIVSLPETPQFIFAICIGSICFWLLKEGLEVFGRISIIFLFLISIVVVFTTLFLIKDMSLTNIKPIGSQGFKKILSGSFSILTFPLTDTCLFMVVLSSLRPKDSPYKVYFIGIFIGGMILLIILLRNILTLGVPTLDLLYFPAYASASILNIGDFITRIEILVASNFLLAGIVKISIGLYAFTKGIAKVFSIDNYKLILAPATLFFIAFSGLIYNNFMQVTDFEKTSQYFFCVFQLILPAIILIFAEIKVRKNKKAAECEI